MKMKLIKLWETLSVSFWFLPFLIIAFGIGLAFLFVNLDAQYDIRFSGYLGLFTSGETEGARAVLSAIASSMMTIAGIIFSITIVTLVLASSQMGPRVLRNFIKSKLNQVVLGSYVASFIYCLLVLRVVSGENHNAFVPTISLTFAMAQAIANILLLIFFINHVSSSIQADNVVADLSKELGHKIEIIFPEEIGKEDKEFKEDRAVEHIDKERYPITEVLPSLKSNYLESIGQEKILELSTQNDLVLKFDYRPGHYIIKGCSFMVVHSVQPLDKDLKESIYACFNFARRRSPAQDAEFVISQIVEVAVRALSPSLNDPFTVITCIDKLGAAVCDLTSKEFPSSWRLDDQGNLRIIANAPTFEGMVDAAFNQIRQYGKANADILTRLMDTFAAIVEKASTREQFEVILKHARMVNRAGEKNLEEPHDLEELKKRYLAVLKKLPDEGSVLT